MRLLEVDGMPTANLIGDASFLAMIGDQRYRRTGIPNDSPYNPDTQRAIDRAVRQYAIFEVDRVRHEASIIQHPARNAKLN